MAKKKKIISGLNKIKINISDEKKPKEEKKEEKQEVEEEKIKLKESIEDIHESQESRDERFIPVSRQFQGEFKSPVLEFGNSNANLETDVQDAPKTTQLARDNSGEVKEVVYVQNAPKYSSDYNMRSYDNFEDDFDNNAVRRDVQMDITQGRLMHRAPVLEPNQDINLRTWQRENVFNRQETGDSWQGSSEREYQILGKKDKKRDDKLHFKQ